MVREIDHKHDIIIDKALATLGPILTQEPAPGPSSPHQVSLVYHRTMRVIAFVGVERKQKQLPVKIHDNHALLRENRVHLLGPRRRPEVHGVVPAVVGRVAREHRGVGMSWPRLFKYLNNTVYFARVGRDWIVIPDVACPAWMRCIEPWEYVLPVHQVDPPAC